MKATIQDSIGKTYNYILVLGCVAGIKVSAAIVRCKCLYKGCGTHFDARLASIKVGSKKSCGCLNKENIRRFKRIGFLMDRENQRHAHKSLIKLVCS